MESNTVNAKLAVKKHTNFVKRHQIEAREIEEEVSVQSEQVESLASSVSWGMEDERTVRNRLLEARSIKDAKDAYSKQLELDTFQSMHIDKDAEAHMAANEWRGGSYKPFKESEMYLRGDAQYDYLHKNHPLKHGKFDGNILDGNYLIQKGGDESRLKDKSAHPTLVAQSGLSANQRGDFKMGRKGIDGFSDESRMVKASQDHGALRWNAPDQHTYQDAPDARQMLGIGASDFSAAQMVETLGHLKYDTLGNNVAKMHKSDRDNMAGGRKISLSRKVDHFYTSTVHVQTTQNNESNSVFYLKMKSTLEMSLLFSFRSYTFNLIKLLMPPR